MFASASTRKTSLCRWKLKNEARTSWSNFHTHTFRLLLPEFCLRNTLCKSTVKRIVKVFYFLNKKIYNKASLLQNPFASASRQNENLIFRETFTHSNWVHISIRPTNIVYVCLRIFTYFFLCRTQNSVNEGKVVRNIVFVGLNLCWLFAYSLGKWLELPSLQSNILLFALLFGENLIAQNKQKVFKLEIMFNFYVFQMKFLISTTSVLRGEFFNAITWKVFLVGWETLSWFKFVLQENGEQNESII